MSRAPRTRLGKTEACPRLTFKRVVKRDFVAIHAIANGGDVGTIMFEKPTAVHGLHGKVMPVSHIGVDRDYQRCGIGTRLYERAAKEACRRKATLASDAYRSVYSQGFWSKQVSRGRAVCMADADPERAVISMDRATRVAGDATSPAYGRGGCERYRLLSCDWATLAGRQR